MTTFSHALHGWQLIPATSAVAESIGQAQSDRQADPGPGEFANLSHEEISGRLNC